jgi:class 3 adenylate cyclase
LRFDFTHFAPVEKKDVEQVEFLVNQKIRENLKVETKIMTVEEALQTGAMALFGAPIAHEDHAQRACYAALCIQKALADYGARVKKQCGMDFKMRIGLNSGPVVVGSIGDDLRMDYTAIGDTTNLAARVEQAAKPGEVWMSQETRNIIRGFFKGEFEKRRNTKGLPMLIFLFEAVYSVYYG